MVDIHSHILFNFDDGPETIGESVHIIRMLEHTGVKHIVLTPHFYPSFISVREFALKRENRTRTILGIPDTKKTDVSLYFGAEVHMEKSLLEMGSLKELCFSGTNNILLEIPSASTDFISSASLIEKIMTSFNIVPIIAHVERYVFFRKKPENLRYLIDMGCFVQCNASCFITSFLRKNWALKALNNGLISVIASDCHSINLRPPNLTEAYKSIESKLGTDAVRCLKNNAYSLINKDACFARTKADPIKSTRTL